MKYIIEKTTFGEVECLMEQYLLTLNGVTDDFWEHHICEAEFYAIKDNNNKIGYFAIFHKDKLTQFYLEGPYLHLAQPIFKQVLADYGIKTAFVATCDQLFLSLCLDFHSKIEMQAYFFDGTVKGEVKPAEYKRECFIRVKPEELPEVFERTGNFFEGITKEQMEAGVCQLYQMRVEGETLGYGIIVPNKLQKKYWAVGMIVIENQRCKGIGRSIQLHLADITRENGYIPISGCWYYNHLSKKTIESAGRYTKTRLLNVIF